MSRMKKMEKELRDSWERRHRVDRDIEAAKRVLRKCGGLVMVGQDIGGDSVGPERVEVRGTGRGNRFKKQDLVQVQGRVNRVKKGVV